MGVSRLTLYPELKSKGIAEEQREIKNRRELGEISTKEIYHHNRMSEKSPAMTPPLIEHVEYNSMEDYGDKILLGTA